MASLMGRARLMSTAELDTAEFFDTILSLALRRRQCRAPSSLRSLVAMRSAGHEKKNIRK